MNTRQIIKIPEDELLKEFPIRAKTKGWFFAIAELSEGHWKISGSNKWNQRINLEGIDLDELIIEAESEASRLKGGTGTL